MEEIGYELQVVAACQYGDVLVDQLLKLLGEAAHGAVLEGEAAMVLPEAIDLLIQVKLTLGTADRADHGPPDHKRRFGPSR